MIEGGRRGYALGSTVGVDLHEAAELLADARERLDGGAAPARRALDLLGSGAVLVDEPDAPWLVPARAEGERLLRAARLALGTAALRAEAQQSARMTKRQFLSFEEFLDFGWKL